MFQHPYPYECLQPGRNWNSDQYRFGFNGQENDKEVKGTGNQQDYGMRIYDPRLGRFLSADPLIVQQQKYPELSPYQFASNTPIMYIDIDGLEGGKPASVDYATGTITEAQAEQLYNVQQNSNMSAIMSFMNLKAALTVKAANHPNTTVVKAASTEPLDVRQKRAELINSNASNAAQLKELQDRDPIGYGGPGFGSGLARDPFVQGAATTVLTGGLGLSFSGGSMVTNFFVKGSISAGTNVVTQIAITGDVDLIDAGASFVFHKPSGLSLAAYSFSSGFFDYSARNNTFSTPFNGTKSYLESSEQAFGNIYFGYLGGQAQWLSNNNTTRYLINTGMTSSGSMLIFNFQKYR